jgi:patatin-like phospholipase/acyl hydrolase
MNRFRILSLDGGAFSASVLTTLEEATGCLAAEHFDLIVGTSTGGIIALGVGLGLPAKTIRDFYAQKGTSIFPRTGVIQSLWCRARQLVGPKRSRAKLEAALKEVFQERRLGESRCRLVLATYDAIGGRIYLLKTAHHARFQFEHKALAVDCALATAAAPTYFQASPFPEHRGSIYIDGGVWANCPALVGVTEALSFLGVEDAKSIDVLSIGTTSPPFSVSASRRKRGGALVWNVGILELMMRAQMEASLAQANLLTGGNVHRIDVKVEPGRFSLDDSRDIDDLIALGDGEARKNENLEVVRQRFLNGVPAERFRPVPATGPESAKPT